jgi:hypothetical protein
MAVLHVTSMKVALTSTAIDHGREADQAGGLDEGQHC